MEDRLFRRAVHPGSIAARPASAFESVHLPAWNPGNASVVFGIVLVEHQRTSKHRIGVASIIAAGLLTACAGNDPEESRGSQEASPTTAPAADTDTLATAAPSPRGRIVFDAGWDIYVAHLDGSGLKRLTRDRAREYDPSWSPDGTKIAYRYQPGADEEESEIYVMNANGSGKRRLTRSPGQDHSPDWSPDGSRIAFGSTRGGRLHVWVMNADGSNPARVTSSVGGEYPAWSPDGTEIAFDVNTDFEPNVDPGSTAGWDVFVVNADGSGLRRLTNDPADDTGASWSPDGHRIVYQSDRGRGAGLARLWTMSADGSEEKLLSDQYAFRPTWSRDGAEILFSWDGLYVVNADGSGLRKLSIRVPGEIGFVDWTE